MAVQSVTQSQTVTAANELQDVMEIVFTVGSLPGSFTVDVPLVGDWVAAAASLIAARTSQVEAAYAL